jgi:pyridoxal 5'-phosphate synthase glutaminase subunit Pdx2
MRDEATFRVKAGLAEMLKGGVIMDVVDAEQAKIAEDAGAAAVMALERVPADIRRDGGVARMSDPLLIRGIQEAVTIPVMAKARIGHFAEAQVLEALEVDYIDESEVLTPADEANHIDKWAFKIPFVCGATNLGEALRRIGEGAAMIRSKGEAGTGDIVEAVRHLRRIGSEIRRLQSLDDMELATAAKEHQSPLDLVRGVAEAGRFARDAARRRGRVRRLGHLQVRGPGHACRRDRRGDHALPRRRSRRARLRGPRAGDGLARVAQARGAAAPRQSRLVSAPLVGVLALQGDFEAHARVLRGLGAEVREVRVPADLTGLDGLVIPGGESTTMTLGIEREGLAAPLRELVRSGTPVLGTCAGMIMLDREHLGLADYTCRRNAFGRQIRSFEADLEIPGIDGEPVRAVFIRAPWIDEHGDAVEVLAEVDGHVVAARQDNMLVISFHPEIAGETRLHELFMRGVAR